VVNAVRTLLRNTDGDSSATAAGDEYVPADYRAVPLPDRLALIHETLFGRTPDALTLNVLLRQYLAAIHGSELEGLALALDPRVTYLPLKDSEAITFGVSVVSSNSAAPFYIGGAPMSSDASGISEIAWTITRIA
jgi:hypothetical protein